MRLQLKALFRFRVALATAAAFGATSLAAAPARAQVAQLDTAQTVYYESPTRTNMFVYTPGVSLSASPASWITVRGGYEADIVSGASVAVKAGPAYQAVNPGVDVITTASVHDFRHSPRGGITVRKGDVSYTAEYTYSIEHDYISNSIFVGAHTEAYEHNTQFDISYARNFDLVCDRVQAVNDSPTRFRALENSSGCFTGSDPLRTRHSVAIDGFQASWTQAWTPTFATQATYTAQIIDGFQSNPYRSIILAQGLKSQEHHPENRTRQSASLRANFFLRPIKLAIRVTGRVYHDTWDITSGTGELELEKYLFEGFRVAGRGRFYKQSGAVFWSDDYTGGDPPLGPKGQFWTGDRELSPFWSITFGGRIAYAINPEKRLLGMFTALKVGAAADVMQFDYQEYTLAGTPVDNARAYIVGLNLSAAF